MAQVMLMNPSPRPRKRRYHHERWTASAHPRGPGGRFVPKRRRNPESRSERSAAAKRGWAHRRRHRNPESRSERSAAAKRGWAHRRHRNPESRSERSAAAKRGWAHRRRRRNPVSRGSIMEMASSAGVAALGALVMDISFGFFGDKLPTNLVSGTLEYVTKSAAAVGLTLLAEKVPGIKPQTARELGIGALTVVFHEAARSIIETKMPSIKLGYLEPPSLLPGGIPGQGMGYLEPPATLPYHNGAGLSGDQDWESGNLAM